MTNKQKILITGCLGFIGSVFCRKYTYENVPYDLTGIDKANSTPSLNNSYISNKFSFNIGDLTDRHCMDRLFAYVKPNFVLHTATIKSNDTYELLQNNILATQNIIDLCVRHNVKRLIFISTEDVYADALNSNDKPSEEYTIYPNTPYAISKYSEELLIKNAGNIQGLKYNIGRFCSVYGNRQPANNFIPQTIKSIFDGTDIFLNNRGGTLRDWIHISDCCRALMKLIETNQENQTFNITSNHQISDIELVQKICNILGKGWDQVKTNKETNLTGKTISMNAHKMNELGWSAEVKLPKGLQETADWYKNNNFFIK